MIDKTNIEKTNAWPFVEAKKVLRERKKYIEKKGKIILSDDDSGGNYNFAIHQKLPPGDYILSVTHCCFGEGPFSLTFEQDPANKTRPSN